MFFTISGFLFQSCKSKRRQFKKILMEYIVWTFIYHFSYMVIRHTDWKKAFLDFIKNLFLKGGYSHLWFVYVLLLCYVCVFAILGLGKLFPIDMRKVKDIIFGGSLALFISITIILHADNSKIVSIISAFSQKWNPYWDIFVNGMFARGLPYFVLGYKLGDWTISLRKMNLIICMGIIYFAICIVTGVCGANSLLWRLYVYPMCTVLMLYSLNWQLSDKKGYIKALGKFSGSIYFMHILVIELIEQISFEYFGALPNSVELFILTTMISIGSTVLISYSREVLIKIWHSKMKRKNRLHL